MYILFCETNKKNMLQKEIKDLTQEVSGPFTHFFLKILSCKGPNIYEIHKEKGWGGLLICHGLTDSIVFNQQIYCQGFIQAPNNLRLMDLITQSKFQFSN